MIKWKCGTCGWIYDPQRGDSQNQIEAGIAFEDLPGHWNCPVCNCGKELFETKSQTSVPHAHVPVGSTIQPDSSNLFKERFENVFRVAQKLTSSLNIGEVLEMIRDEARTTLPRLQEVCLLVIDPEAQNYTRPLHCAVEKQRINCQLCKRGRSAVNSALSQAASAVCFLPDTQGGHLLAGEVPKEGFSEIVFPIHEGDKPLAVLDAIAKPGTNLSEREFLLLRDLVQLASNVIKNARSHWKMSQEKLTVDRILNHLRPFVPSTVQKIVEKDPSSPDLEKKDIDVTVLFLDVAGYTRISETQTRDKVTFIIEKYFSSFLDIIYTHEGDINETAGDGLMVIFQGDPKDTALSAVQAALQIRNKTLEINDELKDRFLPIEINMGINSGTAAVGMSRFAGSSGTRMTFTATGPVTNLAARIAAAAKNGDILLGPDTAARVIQWVKLFDRGRMNFKNVRDTVQVFSVVRDYERGESPDVD
jgi:class 3 adenylate cyclase/rubredoxin